MPSLTRQLVVHNSPPLGITPPFTSYLLPMFHSVGVKRPTSGQDCRTARQRPRSATSTVPRISESRSREPMSLPLAPIECSLPVVSATRCRPRREAGVSDATKPRRLRSRRVILVALLWRHWLPTNAIRPAQHRDLISESPPTFVSPTERGQVLAFAFVTGNEAAPIRMGILSAAHIAPLARAARVLSAAEPRPRRGRCLSRDVRYRGVGQFGCRAGDGLSGRGCR